MKTTLPGLFRLLLLVGVIAGAAPQAAFAKNAYPPAAGGAYRQGEELLRQGRTDAALLAFQRAVQSAPDHPGMRRRLAWLLLDEGRRAEAKPHFEVLASRFPGERDHWVGLIVTLLQLESFSEAAAASEQALARFPQDLLLLKLKAEALMSRPQTAPEAVRVYDELIRRDSLNPQWPLHRQAAAGMAARVRYEEARAYLKEGRLEAALATMAAAVELAPQEVGYRTHYGWLLVEAGGYDQAAAAFTQVLELDAGKLDAAIGLAIARLNLGDGPGAAQAAQSGLARFGREPGLLELLGDAYSSAAATRPQAEQAYRELLSLQPENNRAAVKLARVLLAQGRQIEAEEILEEVVRADPANTDGHMELARIRLRGMAPGRALSHYQQVLQAEPDNTEARRGVQAAERSMRPQLELQTGYLKDSEDFTRRSNSVGLRFSLSPELRAELGIGYLRYDMDNDPDEGRLREEAVDRLVLPLLLTYQPTSRLMLEAGGALSHYDPGHDSGSALAGAYYQVADGTGVSLSYAYYDVLDHLGPFKGPWGRVRDVFTDRDGYRYWTVDPITVWGGNVFGPSSTQAALDGIHAHEIFFWGYQNLGSRVTLSAYGALAEYSDDNEKRSAGFTLTGRVLEDPLLKLKYMFYYLDYSDRSADLADLPAGSAPLYWDPSNFRNNAFGIVYEQNLAARLKVALEADMLWTVGADSPGFMALAELTYYLTDDLALRAVGFFMDSDDGEDSSSNYRQGNFTLGLNYRF